MKKIVHFAASLALFASIACTRQNAVRPPLMGWSSWNAFQINISDSLIVRQADLFVELGLREAGYRNINIDDGYFGYRDSLGYMIPHPERFPSGSEGMRAIVDHIHSLGLRAGIYSDGGMNTCGLIWSGDGNGRGAGLWGHDVQDAEQCFRNWNFDFIKIDFCGGQEMGLDVRERYTELRHVIDSVAGRHIDINVCRWAYPGTWVAEAGDSWRMSLDVTANWPAVKRIVRRNMYLSAYARDGHYNDMDMLVVGYNIKPSLFAREGLGKSLTYTEEEAHFGMWCIMASPLLVGCDLEYVPEETMRIITNPELIAVNQDPLGLQAHVVQHEGETYVLAKDILSRHGKTRAVALYNPAEKEAVFCVPAATFEFAGEMKVRDLNRRTDMPSCDTLRMTLQPHSAKILKIEGRRSEPVLYEAEWGYCPDFTDIAGTGMKYIQVEGASGRAVTTNLGGSDSNYLEWDNIYRRSGGNYVVKVRLSTPDAADFELVVNGKSYPVSSPATDGAFIEIPVVTRMKKGDNDIRICRVTSSNAQFDCIRLISLQAL